MKTYPNLLERITHPRQVRRQSEEVRAGARRHLEILSPVYSKLMSPDGEPYAEMLDNGEVLACYEQVLAEFPDDADSHALIAGLYRLKGDEVNFLKHLSIALALDPQNFLALLKLSDYLCKRNQMPLANEIHERAWTVYVKALRTLRTKPAELAQEREKHFALLDRWATSTSPQKD
ncbi:hypothetical protein LBMAG21_16090 [Armatimonadota bacterium]|nr:hypothetical protein LBMAG21_16090 [Armatimonadota bacterium]